MGEAADSTNAADSARKAELYCALALRAADQLEAAAQRCESADHAELDEADKLRILARDARDLADEIRRWLVADPGTEARIRCTTRLMDLRASADAAARDRVV